MRAPIWSAKWRSRALRGIVREFMDHRLMNATGTLPAKTIIFTMAKGHIKSHWEAFEHLYLQYRGELARMIVSEDSRATDLLHAYEHESMPRISISMDMLDTGIDVPEVCNFVFAKPVFSKIEGSSASSPDGS
ncbi:MAG: hypothetical protein SA339_00890 [Methanomassiliicoccus sp.]|nr:hypothetical protein [Methanomassiliicoccus sp.]